MYGIMIRYFMKKSKFSTVEIVKIQNGSLSVMTSKNNASKPTP